MMLKHEFVEFIPDELKEGMLYVSLIYKTALHNCACGCGMEVVTPISPTDWKITFDGESISLYPSIGNWSFPCRSHYWIKSSKIVWDVSWSDNKIAASRTFDGQGKRDFYNSKTDDRPTVNLEAESESRRGRLARLWNWVGRAF